MASAPSVDATAHLLDLLLTKSFRDLALQLHQGQLEALDHSVQLVDLTLEEVSLLLLLLEYFVLLLGHVDPRELGLPVPLGSLTY